MGRNAVAPTALNWLIELHDWVLHRRINVMDPSGAGSFSSALTQQ
jgi:hypothetical protein